MFNQIQISNKDISALENIDIDFDSLTNDFYDYSNVVVKKPWGYEYLIFCNDIVAIWILHIQFGAQTSMHCHPNKKTSLVVLDGAVRCKTLEKTFDFDALEGFMIDKGVFHQTTAISDSGAFLMEIETPVNKRDLVRLKDKYGREGEGYESKDKHSNNIQNYSYISLREQSHLKLYKKRFGQCSMMFSRLEENSTLANVIDDFNDKDILAILSGGIACNSVTQDFSIGDTMSIGAIKNYKDLVFSAGTEILRIKLSDHISKAADIVVSTLCKNNVNPFFVVPGEANVHLLDAIGRYEGLSFMRMQSEKSASHALEASGKVLSQPGVLIVSSGSSAINAISGVANAWVDSVPMLVISGQAHSELDEKSMVRQVGNKAISIVEIVKHITKYAVKITDPKFLIYHIQKALYLCREGRHGPCWLDIPIDIQGLMLDESTLTNFQVGPKKPKVGEDAKIISHLNRVAEYLENSSRPVLLIGSGVRNAGAEKELAKLLGKLGIPILVSRRGADLITEDNPLFFGRPGAYGQRSANFVLQNCDLLLSVGSRLSTPLIGRNTKAFARDAKKIVVDIDEYELLKGTINIDLAIMSDAKEFLGKMSEMDFNELSCWSEWINKCEEWKKMFPSDSYNGCYLKVFAPEEDKIYPFDLMKIISRKLSHGSTIVSDGGATLIYTLQALRLKQGQRLISSTGLELPGFSISGSIGACVANDFKTVITICEDRGLTLSSQELQTIAQYNLPIKILVLKSYGHSIIRNIQRDYFGSRYVGTDNEFVFGSSPVSEVPSLFGIKSYKARSLSQLNKSLDKWLDSSGPSICEVSTANDQDMIPRPSFLVRGDKKWVARALEEMHPEIDKNELKRIMIIGLNEDNYEC